MVRMASGSLFKRGDKWGVRYRDDVGRQRWETIGRSKKEAERALTYIQGSIHRGEYQAPKNILLRDLANKWLKKCESQVKPRTLESYKGQVDIRINPRFGHLQVRSISTESIDLFITDLTKTDISPTTIGHTLTVLKTILKTGVQWGYIVKNPADYVKKPRTPKKEMDFFNPDEVRALLQATDERHYPIMLTACMTGMRRGELLGLKWEDIDFKSETITIKRSAYKNTLVETKTDHSRRRIKISKNLTETLRNHQTQQIVDGPDNPLGLIFPSETGTPLDGRNMLQRIFWPTLNRAGLRHIRFHDLRHSYASLLISQNVPLKFIQRQLGHSSIQVTMDIYAHLLPEIEKEAPKRLERALVGSSNG